MSVNSQLLDRAIGTLVGVVAAERSLSWMLEAHKYLPKHCVATETLSSHDCQRYPFAADNMRLIADSLIGCKGNDLKDQMSRLIAWHAASPNHSLPESLNVALDSAHENNFLFAGTDEVGLSDGAHLCRIAPIAIVNRNASPRQFFVESTLNASLTHASQHCQDVAKFVAWFIRRALHRLPSDSITAYLPLEQQFSDYISLFWHQDVVAIIEGNYRRKNIEDIKQYTTTLGCLKRVLWCLHNSASYTDAVQLAIDVQHSSFNIVPVTGMLAGAWYGYSNISTNIITNLDDVEELKSRAEALLAMS